MIPSDITFVAPWVPISDAQEQQAQAVLLGERLKRDLPPGHPLSRFDFKIVAKRNNQDDVLCEVVGGEQPLAVVHISWRKEADPRWPRTRFFRDWQHWVQEGMLRDHAEFTGA